MSALTATVLLYGRSSLATSFLVLKYILAYATCQLIATSLLYSYGLRMGSYQVSRLGNLIQALVSVICTGVPGCCIDNAIARNCFARTCHDATCVCMSAVD